jgi:hypothetical protein
MKTIIAGTRTFTDYNVLVEVIKNCNFKISTVLCGGARGVDLLGERYAIFNSIPIEYYYADWEKFKKSAGYIRNAEMLKHADCLIALWDTKSNGTKNMIDISLKKKIPVIVHNI